MSKKQKRLNEAFLNLYIEIDKACCQKFGISTGGLSDYINRLINARFAPGRDEVLPKLVKYKNVKDRLAREGGALENDAEIIKPDLKWLERFKKTLDKKKDPFSVYLRKARRYARRRRFLKRISVALLLLVIAAAAAAVYMMVFR